MVVADAANSLIWWTRGFCVRAVLDLICVSGASVNEIDKSNNSSHVYPEVVGEAANNP